MVGITRVFIYLSHDHLPSKLIWRWCQDKSECVYKVGLILSPWLSQLCQSCSVIPFSQQPLCWVSFLLVNLSSVTDSRQFQSSDNTPSASLILPHPDWPILDFQSSSLSHFSDAYVGGNTSHLICSVACWSQLPQLLLESLKKCIFRLTYWRQ